MSVCVRVCLFPGDVDVVGVKVEVFFFLFTLVFGPRHIFLLFCQGRRRECF